MIKRITVVIFFFIIFNATSQEWYTNIDEAKGDAQTKGFNIVLVFSGSDWCAPCIKLENDIWKSEDFIRFAKDNFIMLKADFPRRKKNALSHEQQEHNNKLAETYNKNGYFPFVLLLDKNGNVLKETGYIKATPSKFIELLTTN